MRHVRCIPDGTKVPRTGHPDPWRARSGETLRACPACRAWGRARTCPASRRKLVDLESRGVSQRGAIQIHPLIRLACDSWQRRDQQLSIRRGSVRSSVLVWNAAARSRIGATAGGYREATKFCQPSCQRKAAKNAGGLSGEGQAVLCVQTTKKRPFSLIQNQPPKTGKVAA